MLDPSIPTPHRVCGRPPASPTGVCHLAHLPTSSVPPPTHVQKGNLPLHIAAMQQHRSVVVVNLLLDAYQDGAKEKNAVRGRRTLVYPSHLAPN